MLFLRRLYWLFWLFYTPSSAKGPRPQPPTSQEFTPLVVPRRTIPIQRDGRDKQLSLYLSRLEDAIQGNNTVRSLYVQIGVLNFQWLTIANATGAQNRNVSLTLAMPHGGLFRMNRYQQDSLPSQSPMLAPIRTFDLYPQPKNRWWPFYRTQG